MAMNLQSGGPKKAVIPVMNVTPLVDVVLVLLIIFMVITPLLTKKFWVHTPKQEKKEAEQQEIKDDPNPPLVLRVSADKSLHINGSEIAPADVPERLRRMFAARDDHVLFFDADDAAPYAFAIEIMDKAREGGAVTIATLPSQLTAPAAP